MKRLSLNFLVLGFIQCSRYLRLNEWLRDAGPLLEQSQILKVWGHFFRPLRLIWPNAERAFSAETSRRMFTKAMPAI
jgi:hypothetical protein